MLSLPGNEDPDTAVRETDTDAAVARLSAAQKQYVQDPFIKHLVPRAHLQPPRPPLINIGTFVRSTAIDQLIEQWLLLSDHAGQRCQIVSLGAGSDTRFWRIATGVHKDILSNYVEIDFPEVTGKKVMSIRKSKELSAVLGNPSDIHVSQGGTALHAPTYHLMPADLRLSPSATLDKLLAAEPILSPSLPTLLLFECVLVYMSPAHSSALLQWFTSYFSNAGNQAALGGIVYEMFGLNDAFGRVMLSNLKTRNVSLPGAEPYLSVESLPRRFLDTGFASAQALTLRDIRRRCISDEELDRVSRLEMLDETEELDLVLAHYAVSWGTLASGGDWGLKICRQ